MSDYNQDKLTQDVLAAFAGTPDPRLRQIMTSLVKHLHAFAREVDLTPDEWAAGLKFLDHVGEISTNAARVHPAVRHAGPVDDGGRAGAGARQRKAKGATAATEATVEGPFYWKGAPELPLGADIGARDARRADALHGPRHRRRRQAARRRAARRVVGRRRRQIRHAASRAGDEGPRALSRRCRGTLLVLVDPAGLLPDPRRRPGRRR